MRKWINAYLLLLIISLVFFSFLRVYLGMNYWVFYALILIITFFLLDKKIHLAFFVYLAFLVLVLLVRNPKNGLSNMSFRTLVKWIPLVFRNETVFINVFGNILLYIPMGLYLTNYIKGINVFIYGFIWITLLEIIQLALSVGVFDVGDILLNMLGLTLGFIGLKIRRWIICQKITTTKS